MPYGDAWDCFVPASVKKRAMNQGRMSSTWETLCRTSLWRWTTGKWSPAFFNTSCTDCRKELPVVQQVYDRYGDNGRMEFVPVSREEEAASVSRYWAEHGLTLPFSAQADRAVYNLFAFSSIPRIYITDTASVVRYVHKDSPLATFEELVHEVEQLLPITE